MRGLKVLGRKRRVRQSPVGSDSHQTRDSVAEDPSSAGSPERVVAPFVLCGTTCQFPPAHGDHHLSEAFLASPRQRAVGRVSANWLGLQVAQKVLAGQLVSPLTWEGWDCVSAAGSVEAAHWASWGRLHSQCEEEAPPMWQRSRSSNLMHHDGPSFTAVRGVCAHFAGSPVRSPNSGSRVGWVAPWTERGRREPCSTQTRLAETCSASHTRRQSGTDSVAGVDEP